MLSENAIDIPGFEGKYAITSDGRVYSHSRIINNPRSESGSLIKGRWLKQATTKKGYKRVALSKDCKHHMFAVHRLVAQAFIPNPEDKPQVNHINGDKTDNRVENLEWATNSENIQHAFDTGLKESSKGEKNGAAKLTEEQVLEIRSIDLPSRATAKLFGISKTNVLDIRSRKLWKHL